MFGSFLSLPESTVLKNQSVVVPFSLSSGAGAVSPFSGLSCGRHLPCLQSGLISIIKVKFSPMGIRRALLRFECGPLRPQLPSGHSRSDGFSLSVLSSLTVILCMLPLLVPDFLSGLFAQPAKQAAQLIVRIAIIIEIGFFIKQVCLF